MNKHTPGPWEIQWRTIWCDEADNFIPGDEYAEHIRAPGKGELYERESICGTCDGCNLIKAANARLMAAAPELLKELQWMRNLWQKEKNNHVGLINANGAEVFEWIDRVDVAIAKATGETK